LPRLGAVGRSAARKPMPPRLLGPRPPIVVGGRLSRG
jgi:hypothetical protein